MNKMNKSLKIAIGIPNTGTIKTDTMVALFGASAQLLLANIPIHLITIAGCYTHKNREDIVEAAITAKCSHLMFVDADMVFEDQGMKKLLNASKDIIGANYHMRSLPPIATIKIADENGKLINVPESDIPHIPFKCFSLPTGFMLIKLDCLKNIEKPYFFFGEMDGEFMGEDVYFCKKAGEAGVDIWCDPTIRIGHLGDYVY